MTKTRILLVDDEENCLRTVKDVFDIEGYHCLTANNANRAMELYLNADIDIVITDVKMPGKSGIDLLAEIKKYRPSAYVLMLTGHGSINDAVESVKLGAYQYILKPVIMEDLLSQIREIIDKMNSEPTPVLNKKLPAGKRIIGTSPRLKNIADLISKISNTDLPVLILGESGTGKELAATAIHYASARNKEKFIAINCAAFPDTLLESELFGYEKGAFTDARTSKPGKIEEADRGTLFLDEIGDMKPAMQAKLLRVLEEQEFQRLGSNKSRKVDIRIISATNQDLFQGIKNGSFRPDLFYRLNAVNLTMPPLREITEDIPILANHFVREFSSQSNKPAVKIPDDVMMALTRYHWPGNVRELANAVRRAVALCDGNSLRVYDLPAHITDRETIQTQVLPKKQKLMLLEDVEKEHILTVLEMAEGNKSLAAKLLGIHRDTLLRKLKKFKMD